MYSSSHLLAVLALAAPPGSGTIRGSVDLVGTTLGSRATDPRDAIVYVEDAVGGALPKPPFEMVQRDKRFQPSLLVVPVGASVTFPNRDVVLHNVFSMGSAAPFDLELFANGESRSVHLERPGIVPVFCNIHPQMAAHILVVSNGFFVRPGADGTFELRGVPPGNYPIVAWFPFGRTVREEVRVEPGQTTVVSFKLREIVGADRHPNKHGKPYSRY